jgi:hypothetical protein
VYDEPTVLVCYRVTGEEEVPEGVVGVLTPDAPDVLSHLSVRARNMKVRREDRFGLSCCHLQGQDSRYHRSDISSTSTGNVWSGSTAKW